LEAINALIKSGQKNAVTQFITALKDPNPYIRLKAAKALNKVKDKKIVLPLISALKDKNSEVRKEASYILGKMKDKRAVMPLIALLKDENKDVRLAAVVGALGEIGDKRAVIPIISIYKDFDWFDREILVSSIEKMGEQGIDGLIAALNDKELKFLILESMSNHFFLGLLLEYSPPNQRHVSIGLWRLARAIVELPEHERNSITSAITELIEDPTLDPYNRLRATKTLFYIYCHKRPDFDYSPFWEKTLKKLFSLDLHFIVRSWFLESHKSYLIKKTSVTVYIYLFNNSRNWSLSVLKNEISFL
jgi:HEAT repeat protein